MKTVTAVDRGIMPINYLYKSQVATYISKGVYVECMALVEYRKSLPFLWCQRHEWTGPGRTRQLVGLYPLGRQRRRPRRCGPCGRGQIFRTGPPRCARARVASCEAWPRARQLDGQGYSN